MQQNERQKAFQRVPGLEMTVSESDTTSVGFGEDFNHWSSMPRIRISDIYSGLNYLSPIVAATGSFKLFSTTKANIVTPRLELYQAKSWNHDLIYEDVDRVDGISQEGKIGNLSLSSAGLIEYPKFKNISETKRNVARVHPYYAESSFQPANVFENEDMAAKRIAFSHSVNDNATLTLPSASDAFGNKVNAAVRSLIAMQGFGPRKGKKDSLNLYLSVGREDITDNFFHLILQWNPGWLYTQSEMGSLAPICDSYPFLKISYKDKIHYYNTFAPYNLLAVWFQMIDKWRRIDAAEFHCRCRYVKESFKSVIISCSAEIKKDAVLPKEEDIVLCIFYSAFTKKEEAFLRVTKVMAETHAGKLNVDLEALPGFEVKVGDIVIFSVLCNVRINLMRNNALQLLHPGIRDVVFTPGSHTERIEAVKLDSDEEVDIQRHKILDVFISKSTQVALIDTSAVGNSLKLIIQITSSLLKGGNSNILICLKTEKCCGKIHKLVKHFKDLDPVLAVRASGIALCKKLEEFTIASPAHVLDKCHLFITTFNAFQEEVLAKIANVTCIIDEGHLCTENETALPLSLEVHKLMMFGKRARIPKMHKLFESKGYDVSLFIRLLEVKCQK